MMDRKTDGDIGEELEMADQYNSTKRSDDAE
jgi:hypothetical protein